MKIKNTLLIIICLIICLVSLSGVWAENTNDTSLTDTGSDDLIEIQQEKTFSDLNEEINSNTNSEIKLKSDFTYNATTDSSFKNGIKITRAVTINGNNHIIDASGVARIFTVENSNVVFKNINFINGYGNKYGGAIYGDATITNCNFTNNTATYTGGAVYGNCIIKNSNFITNNANRFYGGAVYGTSTIENSYFEGNFARLYGGAICCATAKDSTFTKNKVNQRGGAAYDSACENCIFRENNAAYGGAIHESSALKSNFDLNTANDGGAAYNSNVIQCTFTSNTASQRGGATFNSTARNSKFLKNTAKSNGGAGYNGEYVGCEFKHNYVINHKGNEAQYGGGALYDAIAVSSSFENNTAQWGGAILKSSKVENCNFTNNYVTGWAENHPGYGGALYNAPAINCNFTNNTAVEGRGGAMYNGSAIGCTFKNNFAAVGGAIFTAPYVDNCNFENNYVDSEASYQPGNGGALFNATVKNSNFTGNHVDWGSGGAIMNGSAENCIFTKNYADHGYGGAIIWANAVNCKFIENFADRGGALYEATAVGCTFTQNHASTRGGAVAGALTSVSINCIFTGNYANISGGAVDGNATNCTFINNHAENNGGAIYTDVNCHAVGCEFINNDAKYGGAACGLHTDKCNFTQNTAEYGGALYKGSAANSIFTQNSAQNGGAAYESILTKSTFTKNTATEQGPAVYGGKLSSDCKFSSTEDIYNATFFEYKKTFDDLNTLINKGSSNQINLKDDYTFNEALDYNFKKGISPTRAVTINGNGHTIEGCEGARIFNVNVNGVILKNIVFENAFIEGNGGAVWGNATVINCTFKNNRATVVYIDKITQGGAMYGGKAIDSTFINNYAKYGGALSNAECINCVFTDNSAEKYGGAGYNVNAEGCTFTSNSAKNGGAIYLSNAENSLFEYNSANDGGAIYEGEARNCNFTKNTANYGGAAYDCNAYDCIFKENKAYYRAGAIYGNNNNASNCKFIKNTATSDNPTYKVITTGCSFTDNELRETVNIYTGNPEDIQSNGDILTIEAICISDYSQLTDEKITIKVYKDDALYNTFHCLIKDGWKVELGAGTYTAELSLENEKYMSIPINITITIPKKDPAGLSVNVNDTTYPDLIIVDITSDAEGSFTVDIDGENTRNSYIEANKNMQFVFNNVGAGKHTVTVSLNPISLNLEKTTVKKEFTISKKKTTITLTGDDTIAGENAFVYITASENGKVTIKAGNIVKTVDVEAYVNAPVDLGVLNAGTYSVSASFTAGENYLDSSTTKTLKVTTIITNDDIVITPPNDNSDDISITLPSDAKGKVTLSIAGKTYEADVTNGAAKIQIPDLSNGDYSYTLTYSGDDKYNGFATSGSLNINKVQPKVKPAMTHNIKESGECSVSLPNDATGTVTLTINNKNYVCDVKNSKSTIEIPELPNGKYTYTITYSGDEKYEQTTQTGTHTINKTTTPEKTKPTMTISINNEQITATLPNDATGTVTLTINNKNYVCDVKNGKSTIEIPELPNAKYTYTITYSGDEKYEPTTQTRTHTINKTTTPQKTKPTITASISESGECSIILPTDATGTVTLNINNKNYESALKNGKTTIQIPELPNGKYTYTITYSGDQKYEPTTQTGTHTINKTTTPEKTKPTMTHNINNQQITITLPTDATGTITLKINNKNYESALKNGKTTIQIPELPNAKYTYTITYNGNEKYEPTTQTRTHTANKTTTPEKDKPSIKIPIDNIPADKVIKITLENDATGTVTLSINGKDYVFDVKNGVSNVKLPDLDDGNYAYTIKYSGDEKYSSFSQTGNVEIINPKITANDVKVTYNAGSYFKINVNGSDGKPADGVIVEITGKIKKTLTTVNGTAKFKITQVPGTYNITITSLGQSVTKIITVKHLVSLKYVTVKRSAKKLVLTASLGKINKKYLKGKWITFKFNKKTFKAKTNSKGVAKVTVKSNVVKKLKAGKKVTYQATYLKDTVKKIVKVKK